MFLLSECVRNMVGNYVILLVCGCDVIFILEIVDVEMVEWVIMVWFGNECDQVLLI